MLHGEPRYFASHYQIVYTLGRKNNIICPFCFHEKQNDHVPSKTIKITWIHLLLLQAHALRSGTSDKDAIFFDGVGMEASTPHGMSALATLADSALAEDFPAAAVA